MVLAVILIDTYGVVFRFGSITSVIFFFIFLWWLLWLWCPRGRFGTSFRRIQRYNIVPAICTHWSIDRCGYVFYLYVSLVYLFRSVCIPMLRVLFCPIDEVVLEWVPFIALRCLSLIYFCWYVYGYATEVWSQLHDLNMSTMELCYWVKSYSSTNCGYSSRWNGVLKNKSRVFVIRMTTVSYFTYCNPPPSRPDRSTAGRGRAGDRDGHGRRRGWCLAYPRVILCVQPCRKGEALEQVCQGLREQAVRDGKVIE